MRSNLVLCAIIALCSLQSTLGHTYFDSLIINGQTHRECLRAHRSYAKEDPIAKVSDADMTCGFLPESSRPAQSKCSIAAGSSVSLQWWHTQPGDDVVADTHKGPCMVYLAKSDTGAGPVWFKIFENGLDVQTQTWCVDTLIRNRGKLDIQLPANLTAGNYLLRGEVIAMHNGYAVDGAQPYVGCAELSITGDGEEAPPASSLVSFPGAYKNTDAGLWPVSLYEGRINKYTIPGPAVWGKYSSRPSSGNSGGGSTTPSSSGSNNNNGGGSSNNGGSNGAIPTVSSASTCGAVTISTAMRAGASWGNPINNIFDITVVNRGNTDITDLVIKITLDSNTAAYRVSEAWNMVKTEYTYWFSERIGAGKTYKGAGYIVQGGSASVQVVCASSSGQQPGYEYASSSSSAASSTSAAAVSTSSSASVSSSSSSSSTSSSSTTGTDIPTPPSDASCRAGISFTLSNSWNGGGMVSIVVSNTGTKAIKKLQIRAEVDSNAWNLVATSEGARVYTIPSWSLPLAPGARFDGAGYTFSGPQPTSGSVVLAEC